ncbi:MAG: formate dehydrogenase accessory sulfurtransferase FdhD [Deltaproteobacteria bacterium]|nr:formate dehydrogenase accessory sulfurtransferase FdhD [Deltaproteobacteria bacterium]
MRPAPGSKRVEIVGLRDGELGTRHETIAVEEPLELRLDGGALAVAMRTPGHDVELAAGFVVTEGIVGDFGAVCAIAHCDETRNTIEIRTEPGAAGVRAPEVRHFIASSSCGICGKATLDEARRLAPALRPDGMRVGLGVLEALPDRLRAEQRLFDETGALHAAALFDSTGALLCAREDIGRHNAVDKVVGWAALESRLPLSQTILLVSGRLGFEIAQKALVAGIPVLAAISGPSSLAVELARASGMTLVAFLRGASLNVYAGAERIANPDRARV